MSYMKAIFSAIPPKENNMLDDFLEVIAELKDMGIFCDNCESKKE